MHEIYLHVNNGKERATFRNRNEFTGSLRIEFDVPFSDEPQPAECQVQIYNLSHSSRSKIKKGSSVSLEAGYRGDVGLISKGKIRKVYSSWSGVDRITTIVFSEGRDYTDKKDVDITFKKGTSASTIIKRVATKAKISISTMSLEKNKVYKKGYTANGDAIGVIEEVVRDCKSSIYYRRGSLIIRSIKHGKDERFTLKADTGLIDSPERVDSDDYTGWSVTCLLQHRISTASIISIKSKTANGSYRVKNGNHSFDGTNFYTTCEVV